MIKDRFRDEGSPEELLQKKIAQTPVWDEFTPEEQAALKQTFLQNLLKNNEDMP